MPAVAVSPGGGGRMGASTAGLELDMGFCTDIGLVRADNEDAVFISPPAAVEGENPRGRLVAVADGMGGHSGGGLASALACGALNAFYQRPLNEAPPWTAAALERHLVETVLRVDRLVRRMASGRKGLCHMGTTLSCLLLTTNCSIVAHVGDSRIYRWRREHLTCLTTDHTFVQEMIFEGEVDPESAHLHPLRHLLTNVVGTIEPLSHVDHRIDRIQAGDRFLLCSDGLHNVLTPEVLATVLARGHDADRTAKALVAAALERQTADNVTALIVTVKEHDGF